MSKSIFSYCARKHRPHINLRGYLCRVNKLGFVSGIILCLPVWSSLALFVDLCWQHHNLCLLASSFFSLYLTTLIANQACGPFILMQHRMCPGDKQKCAPRAHTVVNTWKGRRKDRGFVWRGPEVFVLEK